MAQEGRLVCSEVRPRSERRAAQSSQLTCFTDWACGGVRYPEPRGYAP